VERKYAPYDPSRDERLAAFHARLGELHALGDVMGNSPRSVMQPESVAHSMVGKFFTAIERAGRGKNGMFSPIRSWAARGTEHMLRVAACLAVFERGTDASITPEDIKNAAALVSYSLKSWLYQMEKAPGDAVDDYAPRLLAWIRKQPGQQANETAMLQLGPKPRSASLRDTAISQLSGEGKLAPLDSKTWVTRYGI
jgi:hypothetical protein